jgi:uncharacterized OB-fold protein
MAKAKTFADKLAKSSHDYSKHCPKCGESFVPIKLVQSEKSKKTGAWKFNEKYLGLCKCNSKGITG